MTAGTLIAFEQACRASDRAVNFMLPENVDGSQSAAAGKHVPWHRWRTHLDGKRQTLVPDAIFVLEYAAEPEGTNHRLCFVEADRGTMPLKRSRGSASCIERKLRLYTHLWKSGQFSKVSGVKRIQVWIVTESAARAEHMRQACALLPAGRGLFHFVTMAELEAPGFSLAHL